MSPRVTPCPAALRTAVALATLALAGCAAADQTVAPGDPPGALAASPALLAAVGDAEVRLLPTVDPALRPALGSVLAELHAALDAGQVLRSRRALAAVQSLVADAAAGTTAGGTPANGADAADLAAVAMLVTVAELEVAPTAAGRIE